MEKLNLFLIVILLFSCNESTREERFRALDDSEKEELVEELKKMVEIDQLYRNKSRSLDKSSSFYEQKVDSLWNIIDSVDIANTKRLIEITEKYGFPSVDRINAPIPAWIIFQHSPKKYIGKLKVLLKNENKAGRLPSAEYAIISWHLNGRKGFPFDVKTIEDNENL